MQAPIVIGTLDNYEVFRLMDTWLRPVFVLSWPTNVRLILSGRQPPVAAWLASSELEGLVDKAPARSDHDRPRARHDRQANDRQARGSRLPLSN
jgi:hypothetical protein